MKEAPAWPRMQWVRQCFPETPALDLAETVRRELGPYVKSCKPGARIAVAVGSRGISKLQEIVLAVIENLRGAGARPFVVPAMGSHGGATPEGQMELLGEYGIKESVLGVPMEAGMETVVLGQIEGRMDVHFSKAALEADGIVVINRVKPHTDFRGILGSGILKMMVVGLGKRAGAAGFHRAANRFGFEQILRAAAEIILAKAPIGGGLALVEDQRHAMARIQFLAPDRMVAGEEALFEESARLMPRLPFSDVDVLIVDCMGKNISGSGMDPNVIGRGVHGYSTLLRERNQDSPAVRRLFVRSLTPESHGNAIGLGMADFATARLVREMNRHVTTVNTLTSMSLQGVKVPIYFETDEEVLRQALDTLALFPGEQPKVMRIRDTLHLERVQVSEAYRVEMEQRPDALEPLSDWEPMHFDDQGNLPAWLE